MIEIVTSNAFFCKCELFSFSINLVVHKIFVFFAGKIFLFSVRKIFCIFQRYAGQ